MLRIPGLSRRNRRRDSGFTFSVKLPAETTRRGRQPGSRWRGRLLSLVFLAGITVLGVVGFRFAQDRWIHRVERLALKKVLVSGEGLLSEEEIRSLCGLEPGRNVLTVDLYQVRQRLLRHPRIEEARIAIDFPDTVRLEVRERIPVARIPLPPLGSAQTYYLVDDLGAVFLPFRRGAAPAEVLESEAALPNLVGVRLDGIVSGAQLKDPRILSALRLLTVFDHSRMEAVTDLVEIDATDPATLTVLTRNGSRITVSNDRDFERQITEWMSVSEFGQRQGLAIAQLDLSVTNHPPLRWADPGTPLPEPENRPRPAKRKPTRRHV